MRLSQGLPSQRIRELRDRGGVCGGRIRIAAAGVQRGLGVLRGAVDLWQGRLRDLLPHRSPGQDALFDQAWQARLQGAAWRDGVRRVGVELLRCVRRGRHLSSARKHHHDHRGATRDHDDYDDEGLSDGCFPGWSPSPVVAPRALPLLPAERLKGANCIAVPRPGAGSEDGKRRRSGDRPNARRRASSAHSESPRGRISRTAGRARRT